MNTSSNSNSNSSSGDDQPSSILIVDDDEIFRQRLARAMTDRGLDVRTASDAPEALVEARKGEPPELAVVDLRMPGGSGLDVVRELKALEPAMRIVVLTGYGSIATAVEAIKLGATNYLTKPADADEILNVLQAGSADAAQPSTLDCRPRRWRAPSGSTSSACSPTVAATSPRPRAASACTADLSSASSARIRRGPDDQVLGTCPPRRPEAGER